MAFKITAEEKAFILAARIRLMYHGTSSTFLDSIKNKGLGVGKERVWNAEKGKLESFGGVYLSNNFGVASLAALQACNKFKGNRL